MNDDLVVVKGAGDLASGVAYRLVRSGWPVVMTEISHPTVVRRSVAFAEAVFDGSTAVEDVTGRLTATCVEARAVARAGEVAVLVDPHARCIGDLLPLAVIDGIMAKRNLGTSAADAPVVIALGPGFRAPGDAHAVIETNRGHRLGRVIVSGEAEPDTGVPAAVGGHGPERVLRAPADGVFTGTRRIGDDVRTGEVLGTVGGAELVSPFDGCLRGLIHDATEVHRGMKIGDVDPRATREHCFTVSDKALSIGGGVLEALLYLLERSAARSLHRA